MKKKPRNAAALQEKSGSYDLTGLPNHCKIGVAFPQGARGIQSARDEERSIAFPGCIYSLGSVASRVYDNSNKQSAERNSA